MPTIMVHLNGTPENPFHKLGLTQNPFPQIAEHKWSGACLRMQSLGGDPIPHDTYSEYIRERLKGFSEELIGLCISRFQPGKYVTLEVSWD